MDVSLARSLEISEIYQTSPNVRELDLKQIAQCKLANASITAEEELHDTYNVLIDNNATVA